MVEPALGSVAHKLTGGLRLPHDETGDCQLFTQRLAALAQAAGVTFEFGQHIDQVQVGSGRVTGVICDGRTLTGDAYVVACGSYSSALLRQWMRLPVYPLKGYSLTIPLTNETAAPVSTVLDETFKVAVTRFDQRIRVGGMAEIVGFDTSLNLKRRETLEMVVRDLFPEAGAIEQATFWTGLRPMTPDGTPLVGRSPLANLYLNTGHGTLGWTMACGSGQLLADIISGKTPDIAHDDLSIFRYANA